MSGIRPQLVEPDQSMEAQRHMRSAPIVSKPYVKKRKVGRSFLLIAILTVAVMGTLIAMDASKQTHDTESHAAPSGPTLALSPATKTGKVNDTFVLGMQMNTNTDSVSAMEIHLAYDPSAIQILNFTPGSALPVVLVPESHASGNVSVTLGVHPASPFKGATVVGTWNIKILTAKSSNITITSGTQIAAIGKTANVLVSTTGTSVTGTIPVTVTASPTVTVTTSPTVTVTTSPTVTSSPTTTVTASPTATGTSSPTPTGTGNPTDSVSPTVSDTPTSTPTVTTTPTPNFIQKIWDNIFGVKATPTLTPTPDVELPSDTISPTDVAVTGTPVLIVPTDEAKPQSQNIFVQFWDGIVSFFQNLFKSK